MLFINTRPKNRAKKLTEFLQQQQISVLDLPLLELVACELDESNRQRLAKIDSYQHVVLVSETAADYFLSHYHPSDNQKLVNRSFIAVGQKTKDTFKKAFFNLFHQHPNIISPSDFDLPENNEGMLQLSVIQSLQKNDKILLVKGLGGRELLKNTLEDRQIHVDGIDFYQRILPPDSEWIFEKLSKNIPSDKAIVLISSLTAWEHWCHLLKIHKIHANDFGYMVLQNRIAMYLKAQNIYQIITIDNLKNHTILSALQLI